MTPIAVIIRRRWKPLLLKGLITYCFMCAFAELGTRVVGCLIPHSTQQETRSRLTFLELLSIFYEVIMSIKGKI
jgi:hypothetical protein